MAPTHSRHVYHRLPEQSGPPCAPWQRPGQDVPCVRFDINGTTAAARKRRVKQYKDGICRRIQRAKHIGPAVYYDTPITPLHNRENPKIYTQADPNVPNSWHYDPKSGHSYHTVELFDSGGGNNMRVQLLICDYNQYMVAFRRLKNEVWSWWYHCSDWPLPAHFNAVSLPKEVAGDHSIKSTIGGSKCLESMFYGLANYPEHQDAGRVLKAFLRAVVIFCEAIRLRVVYDEMVKRLGSTMDAVPLAEYMWAQIDGWGNLCDLVLECAMKRGLVNQKSLTRLVRDGKMVSFYLLIVIDESELMLLMRNDDVLLPNPKVKNLTKKVAIGISDPGFVAPAAGMA